MSTIMGVNVAGGEAYLAFCTDGTVVDRAPHKLAPPAGLGEGERLNNFEGSLVRLVADERVDRVVVLDAESGYQSSYRSFVDRIAIETIFLSAGARSGLEASRISRSQVRSRLSLPRRGALQSHASSILEAVGPYWTNKRDIAALAAMAASS